MLNKKVTFQLGSSTASMKDNVRLQQTSRQIPNKGRDREDRKLTKKRQQT